MVAGLLVMEAGMLPIWRKASTVEAEKTYEDTLRVILMLCCEFVSRMQGLRRMGLGEIEEKWGIAAMIMNSWRGSYEHHAAKTYGL